MRSIFGFLSLVVFFLFPYLVNSQTTKEQLKQIRSSVIEKIDGTDYYIHTVKRGQTLYMISKAYGVEVNDLIRVNPQVKEGIRAEQKIRIPMAVEKQAEVKPKLAAAKEKPAPGKDKPVNQ